MDMNVLTAALPYVSVQMRKPLAFLIKSSEMTQLFSESDDREILSACGVEQSRPDPEAMLNAMKAAGGSSSNPQIDQMLQTLHMIKSYQRISELINQNPEIMNLFANMISQPQTAPPASQNNFSKVSDFIKQFSTTDSADMMTLLTQMLKNSR